MNIFSNKNGIEKLKNIIITDKHLNYNMLGQVLKSDIFLVLQNYMEIKQGDIIAKMDIDQDGNYIFRCKAKCARLKSLGILP